MNAVKLIRFGMVGVLSTLTYFVVTTVSGNPPFLMDPLVAHVMGFASSFTVSYMGHHSITFQVEGKHAFYLPRFLVVTAVLFCASLIYMAIARYWLAIDHTIATAILAITYPLASYALNAGWTFVSPNRPTSET